MRTLTHLFLVFLVASCSSVQLVDSWKAEDPVIFYAHKVFVVGMTPNQEAQAAFESGMVAAFEARGVEAMRSMDLFDVRFTAAERSEEELDEVEQQLLDRDFDAVLFTKVIGVEQHRSLSHQLTDLDRTYRRFTDDYLQHQRIYFDTEAARTFPVYHVETSLYCICPDKPRQLIWRGLIDVTDPRDMERDVADFIRLLVVSMEEQQLIFHNTQDHESTSL